MVSSWRATRWYHAEAESARRIFEAVVAVDRSVAGRIILIDCLRPDVFWSGVYDRPFLLLGIRDVYLTPESHTCIKPRKGYSDQLDEFYLPDKELNQALDEGRVVVLDGSSLTDITSRYRARRALR